LGQKVIDKQENDKIVSMIHSIDTSNLPMLEKHKALEDIYDEWE